LLDTYILFLIICVFLKIFIDFLIEGLLILYFNFDVLLQFSVFGIFLVISLVLNFNGYFVDFKAVLLDVLLNHGLNKVIFHLINLRNKVAGTVVPLKLFDTLGHFKILLIKNNISLNNFFIIYWHK